MTGREPEATRAESGTQPAFNPSVQPEGDPEGLLEVRGLAREKP